MGCWGLVGYAAISAVCSGSTIALFKFVKIPFALLETKFALR